MKKAVAAMVSAVLVMMSLTGCLGSSVSPPAAGQAPETAKEAEAAAKEREASGAAEGAHSFNPEAIGEHTFSLSTTATSGSALAEVAHHFSDQVSELSGGKMTVDVFEGSSLGSEAQNLEALTAGTLDMAIIAVEFYVNSIPQLGALILPYVYDNYDQVQRVLEGEAGQYANQQLLDVAKVKNLGYYVMAFRNMYTTKELKTADDLVGLKIRVPESTLYVNTFKMLGAAPTPLPMGEVYTAIDTGVVAGMENTPDTCLHNSFFEVAKYFNMTNHLNAPTTISMSDKIFSALNEDEQKLLLEAGASASRFGLESTKTSDEKNRETLKEKGMIFVETDVESMRKKIDYNNYDFMQSEEAKKLFELVKSNL